MTDEDTGSSNESSSSDSNTEALAANAADKRFLHGIKEKSGNKNPDGQEAPSADAQSIPSSVDPNASPNSADSGSSDSGSSDSE